MVAVTAAPGTDMLLRRAARIAARVKGELDVVHVIVGDDRPAGDRQSTDGLRQLAADLGARWHEIQEDDPARAIVGFAREHQITQIVIGSSQRSRWHITDGGPILRRVIHEAGASGIDVHIIARREKPPGRGPRLQCRQGILMSRYPDAWQRLAERGTRPQGSDPGRHQRGRAAAGGRRNACGSALGAETSGDQALGELADQLRRAADDGFASFWMSNIFGLDALTALAVAGSQVPGIELGTAVVPTYPRHPAALAQQALTAALAVGPAGWRSASACRTRSSSRTCTGTASTGPPGT